MSRHVNNCLNLEIQTLIKEQKIERAIDHYEEIADQLEFARDLRVASREYLSDPETGQLTLIPRASEVVVIYEDYDDRTQTGEPKKKRDSLNNLLERIEGVRQFQLELLALDFQRVFDKYDSKDFSEIKAKSLQVIESHNKDFINTLKTEIKHVDIRSYALDCIAKVDLVLDKIAKKEGLYQQEKKNDNDLSEAQMAETYRAYLIKEGIEEARANEIVRDEYPNVQELGGVN